MIKICHLTSVHPPFDIRIFHKECISLVNAGYSVTLIALDGEYPYMKNGIQVIQVILPKNRLKRMAVVTFKMFAKADKVGAKVYHFHDPELMFCGVLLRLTGKKVVFDIHENVRLSFKTKEWIPKAFRAISAGIYFLIERFCLLFFNRLILAEESYQKYYPERKSTVVLNYPVYNKIELSDKIFQPPYRFVYAGVVHPMKGIWEMLQLIDELNKKGLNSELILVGEVRPSALTVEIGKYIEENNIKDKVKLIGKVDFTEVSSYLKNAHLGLSILKPIPNYVESLPTKMFEYMQFGLPVITNDFPLYKRYIEESGAGICIDISKIPEMIDLVVKMLNNTQLLEECSRKGIFAVSNKYNWETESRELLNVYRELIG
jgi:glycosyltransferase involved in cell wall biosynthesis